MINTPTPTDVPASLSAKILNIINNLPQGSHVTAKELFAIAKKDGIPVSLATIYRKLEKLESSGLIKSVPKARSFAYESTVDRPSHDHLICMNCGHTVEVESPLSNLGAMVADRYSFAFKYSELILKGLCKNCKDPLKTTLAQLD